MRIRNPFERLSDWQGNYIECLSRACVILEVGLKSASENSGRNIGTNIVMKLMKKSQRNGVKDIRLILLNKRKGIL